MWLDDFEQALDATDAETRDRRDVAATRRLIMLGRGIVKQQRVVQKLRSKAAVPIDLLATAQGHDAMPPKIVTSLGVTLDATVPTAVWLNRQLRDREMRHYRAYSAVGPEGQSYVLYYRGVPIHETRDPDVMMCYVAEQEP